MPRYRIAGLELDTDLESDLLEPFRQEGSGESRPAARSPGSTSSEPLFSGAGWVAGRERRVACEAVATGFVLRIEGVGVLGVETAPRRIDLLETDPAATRDELSQALLGSALCLLTAAEGLYHLHASGVVEGNRTLLFAGASGAGKSTLAAALDGVQGWRRFADDSVLFELADGAPVCRIGFPQLKLGPPSNEAGPAGRPGERRPVTAVFVLDGESRQTVSCERLTERDAFAALTHHTVAAKLFSPALLRCHFRDLARAAEELPVYRLGYPWSPAATVPIARCLHHAAGGDLDAPPAP